MGEGRAAVPVGTARWTAAARARETARPDRLFDDPWAAELAGPDGFTMLQAREPDGRPNPYLPVRTRFVDDLVAGRCACADQVVLLGAGYDTRALRLPLDPWRRVFALDAAAVLEATAVVVRRTRGDQPSGPAWLPVEVDLREPWGDALLRSGFDPATPTLWVAEGLLVHLAASEVDDLLTTAARMSHSRAVFAGDVFGTGLLDLASMQAYVDGRRRARLPPPFCTDDPAGLLRRTGWRVDRIAEPGQEGARFSRLPALPDPWDGGLQPRLRTYLVVGAKG